MREMKDSGVEWIGKIPKDWEIVPLTKQLDSIVDYRGKTPEKTEEGTFLVTAKNIKDGKICYELSKEYVREADYEEIMHRGIPQIGDILFTTEAPLGQVANVDRTDIALAQRIIKFRALSTVNNYYLKYWMLNEGFQQFLHSLSTGSTATGIKSSKLFLLPLVRPKYGTHFTEMDKVLVQMENDYANQEKWQSYAKNNDRATFMLLFEKDFPNMAADRYEQNDQFFRKLFDDPDMMRQVMETVGSVLYERLKKKYIFDPKSGVIEEATPETYVEDTYLTKK